jgi:hypothetical protein
MRAPGKLGEKIRASATKKTEIEPSTLEKIITALEAATYARGEVGGEAKIDRCTTCITKEMWITRQEIVQYS